MNLLTKGLESPGNVLEFHLHQKMDTLNIDNVPPYNTSGVNMYPDMYRERLIWRLFLVNIGKLGNSMQSDKNLLIIRSIMPAMQT